MAVVETRRQQIDDAASALFRARGYPATSVRDIARALDLQGPSLYAHVASKEDVLWSIALRAADRFAEVQRLAEAPGPPAGRLRDLIAAHVRVVTADQAQAAVFLQEWRFLGPERRAEISHRRDAYELAVRDLIAEGVVAGAFRPVDPVVAAAALLSALNGVASWYRPAGRLAPDELAEELVDLLSAGLEVVR